MRCSDCQKRIHKRDTFYLNYSDFVNPLTGEIEFIGNGLCLTCYRNRTTYIHAKKAQIKN